MSQNTMDGAYDKCKNMSATPFQLLLQRCELSHVAIPPLASQRVDVTCTRQCTRCGASHFPRIDLVKPVDTFAAAAHLLTAGTALGATGV